MFCAATVTFWINGMINCWGVLQAELLTSSLSDVPTSTVAFIGSLTISSAAAVGLFATHSMRRWGSRTTAMSGVTLMGLGGIAAGSSVDNVGALFVTIGLMVGVGNGLVYTITNALPVQYFSGKIGLANGLIKAGGGVGGTVMAVALQALVSHVGIGWTFRIQGFMTIATGLPAAWFMKDRALIRDIPFADLSMFRNLQFCAIFVAGAIGTFALFVPPYYLPLFAQAIGLSPSTGAILVAAFNLCNAVGRLFGGSLCDKLGPINTFLITMVLNAVTMLAIWPVSSTMGPLIVFAILNGIANGSFFTVAPTVVAAIFGPGRAAVAMSMTITGFTAGYLMGAPIAGYLLQAEMNASGSVGTDFKVYEPSSMLVEWLYFQASVF